MSEEAHETSADPAREGEGQRRSLCTRCRRPTSVCYCAALTRIETASRVIILQHPREEGMPIGTAHMAHLCLPSSELHVGTAWDETRVLERACADAERPPILLYPSPDAVDILTDPPPGPVSLIVVDGTWSQAKKIVRENPRLAALPRYAFHAPQPSNYRIRREPSDAYVSTLEALMYVLGALERDPARFQSLMRPMNAMVDAQILAKERAQQAGESPRWVRARKKASLYERLPQALREDFGRVVLVVGEANAWPHGTPERALGDELIHWVAHRPATAETFSYLVAPTLPLAPDIPTHADLRPEDLQAGGSRTGLMEALARFLHPDDILCSWGHHSLRIYRSAGGALPSGFLDLRATARVRSRGKIGRIEPYVAQQDLAWSAVAPGRAGQRVGMLRSLVDAWRQRSDG